MKEYYKILIFGTLFFLSLQYVLAETICEFDFSINKNDTVELIKTNSFAGKSDIDVITNSDYKLLYFDSQNNKLVQINLPVEFYVFDAPEGDVESVPVSVRQPCDEKWKKLEILHNNKNIFIYQFKEKLCNRDKICNNNENFLTCPEDCPSGSKDGWCDRQPDSKCDPDCLDGDPDCAKIIQENVQKLISQSKIQEELKSKTQLKSQLSIPNWIYISLPILFILSFLAYIEFKRKKYHWEHMTKQKEQKMISIKNYILDNLKKGFKQEQIKDILIKNNYDYQLIEEIFRGIKK